MSERVVGHSTGAPKGWKKAPPRRSARHLLPLTPPRAASSKREASFPGDVSLKFRYRDRSEVDARENLRGLGHLLISLRIAQGISQRELAKRLNVHESQVSRDGETRISESRANG